MNIPVQDYRIKGSFTWEIVDEESARVERSGAKENLILNQGIDYCFQRSFAENMQACALSNLYIAPLKTDTYLPGEFTRTSAVETLTAANLTSTAVTSAGAVGGYTYPVRTITYTKTFRFPRFNVRTVIGTIGISYSAVSGANLFAKSLIGAAPISVDQGKYLRLNYSLGITFPSSYDQPIPITANGYSVLNYLGYFGSTNILADPQYATQSGAWNTSGWRSSQLIGLMVLNSDGSIQPYTEAISGTTSFVTGFATGNVGGGRVLSGLYGSPSGLFSGQACNEPASGAYVFLSANGQSPNITSSSIDRTAQTSVKRATDLTYIGNGLGIKSATFSRGTAITGVYSWGIGGAASPEKNSGFVCVSTGVIYTGGIIPAGLVGNGYPGLTKLPLAELTLQFYYNVTSA